MKPTLLNGTVLLSAMLINAACLWGASHLGSGYALLAIWLFSQFNLTPFVMMHEANHGLASPSPRWNNLIGTIAGWSFPISSSLERVTHEGHHHRNRTDQELIGYYLPQQSKVLRSALLYLGNLFGLYYWAVVFGNLLVFILPKGWNSRFLLDRLAPAGGFKPFLDDVAKIPVSRIWIELAMAYSYQIALFIVLDLNWATTLLCYMAFALHWSALQYAYHAWSARDIRNGAWNLKVIPIFRWIGMNIHYHRAHHQRPEVPWYKLPSLVDKTERQPSFWRAYFSLWKGARPAPPMGTPDDLDYLFPPAKSTVQ